MQNSPVLTVALCNYADHPWRCLCRGSLQMTRTTRFLRMILQLRHIFFTEASTFMFRSLNLLPYLARNVIRHRVKSYGETSTVTLSPGRMRM